VKVVAADVVATKKILTALKLYPVYVIIHTLGCFGLIHFFTSWNFIEKFLTVLTFALFYPIYHYICI